MWNNLKIGTRLVLAFGGLALVVLLLMVMALSGIGGAEQALQGATPPAQAALAQLQSARNWVIGCSVVVDLCWPWWPRSACAPASWRRSIRPS